MGYKKVLICISQVLIRLLGAWAFIVGLISLPNLFSDGGFTKNIVTLLLRLVNLFSWIITGYGLMRLKKWSLIGLMSWIIISAIIPFHNLYLSTTTNLSDESFSFSRTVYFIVIYLFVKTFKDKLFLKVDNSETFSKIDKPKLILRIIGVCFIAISLYYFFWNPSNSFTIIPARLVYAFVYLTVGCGLIRLREWSIYVAMLALFISIVVPLYNFNLNPIYDFNPFTVPDQPNNYYFLFHIVVNAITLFLLMFFRNKLVRGRFQNKLKDEDSRYRYFLAASIFTGLIIFSCIIILFKKNNLRQQENLDVLTTNQITPTIVYLPTPNLELTQEDEDNSVYKDSSISNWTEYVNSDYGFSFSYPKEFGKIKVHSTVGFEGGDGRLVYFSFFKEGDTCGFYSCGNPIEIGAAAYTFGGMGNGRTSAISAGFIKNKDGSVSERLLSQKFKEVPGLPLSDIYKNPDFYNKVSLDSVSDSVTSYQIKSFSPTLFKGKNTEGILKKYSDEVHNKDMTEIIFNLNHSEIKGIDFMASDEIGTTKNSEILKSIAKTFQINNNFAALKPPYQVKNIKDDTKRISKLVLSDQGNNQIVIDEKEYIDIGDEIIKPSYGGFILSSDNKFLSYTSSSLGGGNSFLYDIKSGLKIGLGFGTDIEGFSLNSKYFYACAEGGYGPGGAYIIELNSGRYIFISDYKSYKCQYDKNMSKILFSRIDALDSYEFLEKTGSLTKIN